MSMLKHIMIIISESTKICQVGHDQAHHVWSSNRVQNAIDQVTSWANNQSSKRIGILARNSFESATAILGIAQSTCTAILVNPKLPIEQLKICLESCEALLTDQDLDPELFLNKKLYPIDQCRCEVTTLVKPESQQQSLIIYTSGSTGQPKSVVYTFQDIENMFKKSSYKNTTIKRTVTTNPFFHLAGITWLIHNLVQGNHLFIISNFDPAVLTSTINQYKPHDLTIIAPVLSRLLDYSSSNHQFESVTNLVVSASALNQFDLNRIKIKFPNLRYFRNPYGLTETGTAIFTDHPSLPTPWGSVGVSADVQIKLVDEVLHVRSRDLWSDVKDVADDWFATGDRFRVDDNGFYYYLGRVDNMFKVNGEKVYPEHVESVLQQHPKVTQVCVVPHADTQRGHVPVAVLLEDKKISPEDLRQHCAKHLAPFEIPGHFVFVDEFPLTQSGKIDRHSLRTYINDHVFFSC